MHGQWYVRQNRLGLNLVCERTAEETRRLLACRAEELLGGLSSVSSVLLRGGQCVLSFLLGCLRGTSWVGGSEAGLMLGAGMRLGHSAGSQGLREAKSRAHHIDCRRQ